MSNPCLHGGYCEETLNAYICHCPPGISGSICEIASHVDVEFTTLDIARKEHIPSTPIGTGSTHTNHLLETTLGETMIPRSISAPSEVDVSCPAGWIAGWNKCYYFSRYKLTWIKSKDFCLDALILNSTSGSRSAASLLAFENSFEVTTFNNLTMELSLLNSAFWLNCRGWKEDWECQVDSWKNTTSFRDWAPGDPTYSRVAKCAVMGPSGDKWSSKTCGRKFKFVCQVSYSQLQGMEISSWNSDSFSFESSSNFNFLDQKDNDSTSKEDHGRWDGMRGWGYDDYHGGGRGGGGYDDYHGGGRGGGGYDDYHGGERGGGRYDDYHGGERGGEGYDDYYDV
ncbi:versican core protein-like [Lytechinus variegatus]|uniref:versican core protein-like n=1 Tax=Lytechinus variegatus TaxID=7654 RepID=UPI001BB2A87B|nr:versican core protein-like [Lytechinus variegatus]